MTSPDAGAPSTAADPVTASRTVLVTGATGYIGGRLVPRLLRDGHCVRAAVTDPAKARNRWWRGEVELVTMNVLDPPTVAAAVEGVDVVYYLIHGLGGDDFAEVDRRSATTMAEAAAAAGVGRIVYLGGLVPDAPEAELSEHISSRLEVERILTASGVPTITLRAAIVTGSGSTSFEIVRQISERLPVQTIPRWMDSRVQPIAISDVVEALAGALAVDAEPRHYDVGGPERMPYSRLLDAYAEVAGLSRPQVSVPGLPTDLVGSLAGVIADVPGTTVAALVESLHHDMVCHEVDWTYELLPDDHALVGVEESFRRALAEPDLTVPPPERDPLGPLPGDPSWAGGQGGGVGSAVAGARAVVTGLAGLLRPGG
ncbi:MAG TPA: NAD(P)H-binding protein [Acidimicrobiales bacterium]|nr:NAD(P)H-binding protein [Acidimicrobiales bacterium]